MTVTQLSHRMSHRYSRRYSHRMSRRNFAVSHRTPTRPDPTRPLLCGYQVQETHLSREHVERLGLGGSNAN